MTGRLVALLFAATAAGLYPNVQEAMKAMGQGFDATYQPDKEKAAVYEKRYGRYERLGRFIGGNVEEKKLYKIE